MLLLNAFIPQIRFQPGKTEQSQAEFIAFTVALMVFAFNFIVQLSPITLSLTVRVCPPSFKAAVHKHGDLIRTGVAVPGNDHRLGAQEAPPAIMSVATGESLHNHLKAVVAGGPLHGFAASSDATLSFDTPALENVSPALDDRNRTAPFPFCGNRFEFRAVGSTQNIAMPVSFLDTAVADGLMELADLLEGGMSARDACAKMIAEHDIVVFNGDGYADAWQAEAEKRGLPNNRNCVDAWRNFDSKKNLDLFERHGLCLLSYHNALI